MGDPRMHLGRLGWISMIWSQRWNRRPTASENQTASTNIISTKAPSWSPTRCICCARRAELRLDLVYAGFEGSGAFLLKWVLRDLVSAKRGDAPP